MSSALRPFPAQALLAESPANLTLSSIQVRFA